VLSKNLPLRVRRSYEVSRHAQQQLRLAYAPLFTPPGSPGPEDREADAGSGTVGLAPASATGGFGAEPSGMSALALELCQ
jgi:hypothetical protein